jgi:hypothetical protein
MKLRWVELAVGDLFKNLQLLEPVETLHINMSAENTLGKKVFDETFLELSSTSTIESMHKRYGNTMYSVGMKDIVVTRIQALRANTIVAMAQASLLVNSFEECLEWIQEYSGEPLDVQSRTHLRTIRKLAKKGKRAEKRFLRKNGDSRTEIKMKVREGTIRARPYPWLQGSQRCRLNPTIERLQTELLRHSNGLCSIHRWKIAEGLHSPEDSYGMFAKQKISRGCEFLVETTVLLGLDNPKRRCSYCCKPVHQHLAAAISICCGKRFCSSYCHEKAKSTFHHSSAIYCAGDLDTDAALEQLVDGTSEENVIQQRLRYRVLQYTIMESTKRTASHPLLSELTRGLVPCFSNPYRFSIFQDVHLPLKMLKNLGVNIFENHQFDTWVLQMLFSKIRANSWDGITEDERLVIGVSQLYSFLNHSCRLNVRLVQKGRRLTMIAKKFIQPGDELCVSYLDKRKLKLPVDQREQLLVTWFPHCLCARCDKERKLKSRTTQGFTPDSNPQDDGKNDSEDSVLPDMEVYGEDTYDSGEDTYGSGEDTDDSGEDTDDSGEDTDDSCEDIDDSCEDAHDSGEDAHDNGEVTDDSCDYEG